MNRQNHKQGFTLIELLIVTVVIVTLMGVVFRLAGTGSDNSKRATTLDRMQRLENALSGYYAAYGSYPPVPLQGRSRSIYMKVNPMTGMQEDGPAENGNTDISNIETMHQILAACRAQPISVCWPITENDESITEIIDSLNEGRATNGEPPLKVLRGVGSTKYSTAYKWRGETEDDESVQLFEFGLLSFLLPRYLFMLTGGDNAFFDTKKDGRPYGQWAANNLLPCRIDTGEQFVSWQRVRQLLGHENSGSQLGEREAGMISNLTSQAVCARWLPNLAGIVKTPGIDRLSIFYGIDLRASGSTLGEYTSGMSDNPSAFRFGNRTITGRTVRLGSESGFSAESGGGEYPLLSMTVVDGWGQEFFYYSEPPYQSYRLWSAGPNNVTFPPWYDRSQFSGDDLERIQEYTEDDIVHMSN